MPQLENKVDNLHLRLDGIQERIKALIAENDAVGQENKRLRLETDLLKEKIAAQKSTIEGLENKNVHLKIVGEAAQTDESTEKLKEKIDFYIREIDKCIDLLNS